jgi:hypothetical protein
MAGPQPRLHLPFARWPAEDRARWASAVTDDDPFSDAPGARLAKTTLHARWMAWRRFLGFLTAAEPGALQIPLTERITIARVRQLAKHLAAARVRRGRDFFSILSASFGMALSRRLSD